VPVAPYLAILFSYLLGAVPFGYIVARLRGVDIFSAGSGNIGATNVGRVLGRKIGLLVFVLDFLKGAMPVALVRNYLPEPLWAAIAAGLAAFVGHMFPIYLRFRGGKGVATGTGAVAVLLPGPTAVALLVWVTVLAATRYVSLASVLAAATLPIVRLLTAPGPFASDESTLTGFSLLAAGLVTLRHRSNLARLFRGQENRIADSSGIRMLARALHVFALGLWLGASVFFTFLAAPALFHTFEGLEGQRPEWLPLSAALTKEQGTHLAGLAVAPLFPLFFALQGACGLVALVTAWGWAKSNPERFHRIRFTLIVVAVALVLTGFSLLGKVEELRFARYYSYGADKAAAQSAFALWHLISLFVNFAVIALVGAATVLAGRLPADPPPAAPAKAG
jgi:glycerol-3-phosphate acyltransferase PlsY